MARVLESLGGVAPADLVFVADGSRRALQEGFAAVERMLRAEQSRGVRRELVFYYSGHSDEEGLLLGGERISYQELRAFIHDAPADLSLAILDSCESGAFTRHKGGARRPPFLLDASIDTRGHAFLTSSAANEVAQESDRIAASFFTYYLVSGLRGAADANRDRRVTCRRRFSSRRRRRWRAPSARRAARSTPPTSSISTGTGDMVVTDVRTTQAGLRADARARGRISVREAGGALIAELRKPAGSTVELGLEAGSYVVAVEDGGAVQEAQLTLAAGEHLAARRARRFTRRRRSRWRSRAAATTPRARADAPAAPTVEATAARRPRNHQLQGRVHPPRHRRPDRRRRLLVRVHRRSRGRAARACSSRSATTRSTATCAACSSPPGVNVAGSLTTGRRSRPAPTSPRGNSHGRADRRRRQRRRR